MLLDVVAGAGYFGAVLVPVAPGIVVVEPGMVDEPGMEPLEPLVPLVVPVPGAMVEPVAPAPDVPLVSDLVDEDVPDP
ncbi:MAG: hypothetical protein H7315_07505 [Herminiimonas sp.]|nr:hypothetical protein [Herminiimonas sp.]